MRIGEMERIYKTITGQIFTTILLNIRLYLT